MLLQLRSKESRPEGGPTSVTVAEKKAMFSNTSGGSQSNVIGLVDMMSVATVLIKGFSAGLRLEKAVILPMISLVFSEHFLEITASPKPAIKSGRS
jgi:hypothetical protein